MHRSRQLLSEETSYIGRKGKRQLQIIVIYSRNNHLHVQSATAVSILVWIRWLFCSSFWNIIWMLALNSSVISLYCGEGTAYAILHFRPPSSLQYFRFHSIANYSLSLLQLMFQSFISPYMQRPISRPCAFWSKVSKWTRRSTVYIQCSALSSGREKMAHKTG